MEPFTLVPLVVSSLAVLACGAVWARGRGQRTNQLTALMLLCGAHWALCETIWNNLEDPDQVMRLIRISGLGWIPLGPLLLHLVLEATDDLRSPLRRALPAIYASAALALGVYQVSPLALVEVTRTSWGWAYRFGPLFPLVATPTIASAIAGTARWRRSLAASRGALEQRQARQALLGMGFTLVLALATDILLPQLGVSFPRLGSVSLILFCGFLAYGVTRHDYFVLAPGVLAQRILESLHEGAVLLSEDLRIVAANEAFVRLVDLPDERVLGARLDHFLPGLPSLAEPGLDGLETELRTGVGQPSPVTVSSSVLHGKAGAVVGIVISVRDLRDLAVMRDRVITAGRLAAVGELAAGVVHEISSPVAWMQTNLNTLRGVWEEAEKRLTASAAAEPLAPVLAEGSELIDDSLEGIERIARLVASVRSFSHAGRGEREMADVSDLLDAAVALAEPKLRQHGAVVHKEPSGPEFVLCAPQELKQLFLNLLINAANAVQRGGRIRLSTQGDDQQVVVSLEDDGCGMSPQQVRGLFEPVFRSLAARGGYAVGLPACHEIVRKHAGEIDVHSERGRGTSFRIVLPRGRVE